MANFFKQIAHSFDPPKVEKSSFDMSHEHKTTLPFGKLVPVYLEETLPGDKWHINPSAFIRSMPLVSPMMHKVDIKLRFFYVPNRLVWKNWERFISLGYDDKGNELSVPRMNFAKVPDPNQWNTLKPYFGKGSLLNYFGITSKLPKSDFSVSQLPFRAYDLIYQEYFCNQWLSPHNVENSMKGAAYYDQFGDVIELDNGGQLNKYRDLLLCEDVSFEEDYFTSVAPTPMAAAGSIPGISISNDSIIVGGHSAIDNSLYPQSQTNGDFSTVSELRQAFRLQHFLENSLRTGKRYVEQLFAHFGVVSSDARIQRPEYLGGGKLAVQISEVAATSSSENQTLGDLAGRGLSVGSFGNISCDCEEHGYIIGLAYVTPQTSYFGGLNRTFIRRNRFDYAFPEFADLGEQPVWKAEVSNDFAGREKIKEIFGYVPRYSEYKQSQDKFSGEMVSSLEFWHLGRSFEGSNVAWNEDFVYINDKQREKLNRVFGIIDPQIHPFVATFGFQANALRPLPFNPKTIM